MKLKEITWSDDKYSCYTGHIGDRHVASVTYSMDRAEELKWILTVEAFGRRIRKNFAECKDAQAHAHAAVGRLLAPLIAE